jgi:hypothetical protein
MDVPTILQNTDQNRDGAILDFRIVGYMMIALLPLQKFVHYIFYKMPLVLSKKIANEDTFPDTNVRLVSTWDTDLG